MAEAAEKLAAMKSAHKALVEKNKTQNLCVFLCGGWTQFSSCSEAEASFIHKRDEPTEGKQWERITQLCDFKHKPVKGSKDAQRMRDVLLDMKQEEVKWCV